MNFSFRGKVWYWKGPAPHHFITVPDVEAKEIKQLEKLATYGWGMIPVTATIGETQWYTAMWPKDGAYILPLKLAVRKVEKIAEGDEVSVQIEVILG
ncbi:MAG TPA: DUF1905 domain-containing protein [Fimbriimonadaceae bacterium]|nr:DUF1905 domain-containing protein [Fimbriimonadaceae bacterium]